MQFKEHVCLLSLQGSALENHLIGIHSLLHHFRSGCLFVPLKGPRCHGTYLHFSFAPLSCGHSPLCRSADIISFCYSQFYGCLCCLLHPEGLFPVKVTAVLFVRWLLLTELGRLENEHLESLRKKVILVTITRNV